MPEFDLFISYNRLDRAIVDPLARALRERDLKVFKDDWYLRPGQPWPMALEANLAASRAVVVTVSRHGMGPWQQREAYVALDRQARGDDADASFPVIPVLLDQDGARQPGLGFLLQNMWVENWDPRAADLIVGAVEGKAPADLYGDRHPDPRRDICPYRGLGAFREEDAAFYFGREPDVERLAEVVGRRALAAVVGPSGSGKSSLVQAGLFPRLRRGAGERVWQMATMLPGADPFLGLARTLLPLREPERILTWSKGDIDDQSDRLRGHLFKKGGAHLLHVIKQILEEEQGTTDFLLLVDQWEELYTNRPIDDDKEQALAYSAQVNRFVRMLINAARNGPLRIVLTLRADYWGEILNDEALAKALEDDAVVHLRALDRAALEQVIRRPAEKTALVVQDGLTDVLLDAAAGQPGDMPLLEFTLQKLWNDRSQRGELTLQAYRAFGGLREAIVNHADAIYTSLPRDQQEAVEGVFAALVQVGDARFDVRRRAPLAELSDAGKAVARRLADERLLVTGLDRGSGAELVEVAHEALLRHWPRVQEWIDARRSNLRTVRRLQADARLWLERNRSPGYLWSHERAAEAVEALQLLGAEVSLSAGEGAFLGPVRLADIQTELDDRHTTHERRLYLGDRLDALGDPRPGVGVDADETPSIEWCRPVGLAKFPVTVSQYLAFIEADDGWRNPQWWGDDLYRDPAGNAQEFGRHGNRPVVNVSWFDAMAFCRWLGHRLGSEVRLPQEREWQQAAIGDRDDGYPWGTEWDPQNEPFRANTSESGLRTVTAVGVYPDGASACGALDLAGTVWEWCLNKREEPSQTASRADDRDARVLRGGSWYFTLGRARSAYRYWLNPDFRLVVIGFRVLCSSPIPEH